MLISYLRNISSANNWDNARFHTFHNHFHTKQQKLLHSNEGTGQLCRDLSIYAGRQRHMRHARCSITSPVLPPALVTASLPAVSCPPRGASHAPAAQATPEANPAAPRPPWRQIKTPRKTAQPPAINDATATDADPDRPALLPPRDTITGPLRHPSQTRSLRNRQAGPTKRDVIRKEKHTRLIPNRTLDIGHVAGFPNQILVRRGHPTPRREQNEPPPTPTGPGRSRGYPTRGEPQRAAAGQNRPEKTKNNRPMNMPIIHLTS